MYVHVLLCIALPLHGTCQGFICIEPSKVCPRPPPPPPPPHQKVKKVLLRWYLENTRLSINLCFSFLRFAQEARMHIPLLHPHQGSPYTCACTFLVPPLHPNFLGQINPACSRVHACMRACVYIYIYIYIN